MIFIRKKLIMHHLREWQRCDELLWCTGMGHRLIELRMHPGKIVKTHLYQRYIG